MITAKINDGSLELEVYTRPPSIYLDHWAVRGLSANRATAERFIGCIRRKGTVLFSWLNVIEISRNTGRSADEIQALLNGIGEQWFPVEFNPFTVIEREMSCRDDDDSPCLGDGFLKAYYPHIHGGDLSLATVIELTRGQHVRDSALAKVNLLGEEMRQSLEQARKQQDQLQRERIPDQTFDAKRPTSFVFPSLLKLLATEGSRFENNDAIDLCHATVALSYGDLVCLDRHWADFGRRLRLPSGQPRIFRPGQISEFLNDFERR